MVIKRGTETGLKENAVVKNWGIGQRKYWKLHWLYIECCGNPNLRICIFRSLLIFQLQKRRYQKWETNQKHHWMKWFPPGNFKSKIWRSDSIETIFKYHNNCWSESWSCHLKKKFTVDYKPVMIITSITSWIWVGTPIKLNTPTGSTTRVGMKKYGITKREYIRSIALVRKIDPGMEYFRNFIKSIKKQIDFVSLWLPTPFFLVSDPVRLGQLRCE